MPHLTIEYSANLGAASDMQKLVDAVHDRAAAHELPPVEGLRTRAVSREHYAIATRDPRYAFVAFTARIGPGRTPEVKDDFLGIVLDTIEEFLATEAPELIVAISGEVQEIDPSHRINRKQIRSQQEQS